MTAAAAPGTSTLTTSAPLRPSKVSAEAAVAKNHDDGLDRDGLEKKVHPESQAYAHSTSSSSASSSPRTPNRALNVSHKKSPRIPFSIPGPSSAAVSVSHSFDEQTHAASSSSSSAASPAAALLTQHLARLPDTSPSGSRRSSFSSLNSHVTPNRKIQNRSSLMSTATSVVDESDGATVSTSRDPSTPIGRRPSQDPSQDPPSPLMATRKLKPSTGEALYESTSAIGGSAEVAGRSASPVDAASDHALVSRPIAGGTNPHEAEGDPAVVPVTSRIKYGEAASSLRRLNRNLPAASKGQAGHSNVSPEILEDAKRVIRPEAEASQGPRDSDAAAGHEEAVLLRAQDEEQQAEEAAILKRDLLRDEHRNIEMRPSEVEESAQAIQSDATALIGQTIPKEDPASQANVTSEDAALKDIRDAPSPAAIDRSPPSPSSSETPAQLDISSHIHSQTLGFEKKDSSQLTQLQRRIKADGDRIKQATEGFLASDADLDNGKTKRGNRLTVNLSLVAHLSIPATGLSRMQLQKRHFRPAVTLLCPLPSLSIAEKGLIGHALVGCLLVGLWIVSRTGIW